MQLPKMYCLTVKQTPWRNDAVAQRFKDAGLDVEFFYGVHGNTAGIMPIRTVWDADNVWERNPDNTFQLPKTHEYRNNPGKTSITPSKLLLWQKCLASPDETVLIFENDVVLPEGFKDKLLTAMKALPYDWDAVHVGHCCIQDKPAKRINAHVCQIKYPLCCHALLFRKSGLQIAYDTLMSSDWGTNSDIILARKAYPRMNHYTFEPALAFTDATDSEAAKSDKWEDIQGWFDYGLIFDEQISSFGEDPAVMVEIGAWLGRSTAYMASEIRRRLRPNIKFYAVDTWLGSANEPDMQATIQHYGGDLYDQFTRNMHRCGVMNYVTPLRMTSEEASRTFADASVDFLFVDGDHSYEGVSSDIRNWLPKMKPGKTMAGHDIDRPGVRKAVDEAFPGKWRRWESCWIVDHCHT